MVGDEGFDSCPKFGVHEEEGEDAESGDEGEEHGADEGEDASIPEVFRFDGEGAEKVGFVLDEAVFEMDDGAGENVAD